MNLPKQLRAVRVYSFTSCLRLTDAVWVALLAARGFTLAQIGLAEAVFHLTSLLCEVPSGVAADLLGRRLNLAVSAVFEIFSDVTMAVSPNLAAVCAVMALKALACTMISGTLEALTYDSLKTAGRENEYLQADAKISVLQKLATALGSLASLLSDVLQFAGAGPAWGCLVGPMLVQASLSVWFLHAMQRFNDAIPSDRRATLISVDNMAYSVLMIPASPLIGLIADVTGLAGAGLCALGGLVLLSALALSRRK